MSIQSLSLGLLAQIFSFIHIDTLTCLPWTTNGDAESAGPRSDEMLGRRFPCSTALVCRYWLKIHRDNPDFWNHVEFDLSLDPSPLAEAFNPNMTYFSLAVFDSRYPVDTHAEPDALATELISVEKDRMHIISAALRPYLQWCLWLDFNVQYTSSLEPLPLILLSMSLRKTQNISYTSSQSTAPSVPKLHFSKGLSLPSTFSSLHAMSLDVGTFLSIGRSLPLFWARLVAAKSFTLTISHFTFRFFAPVSSSRTNASSSSISEFLDILSLIPSASKHLVLKGLSLDENPIDRHMYFHNPRKQIRQIRCASLVLDTLSETFISSLSREFCFNTKDVTIRRGSIPSEFRIPFSCTTLTFDEFTREHDVRRILRYYYGTKLVFQASSAFNDKLLSRQDLSLDRLTSLEVVGCSQFTYPCLKGFLEGYDHPKLGRHTIHFGGSSLPPLGKEDGWLMLGVDGVVVRR